MEHKPSIYALERLHADLGGRIKENRKEALKLARDMQQVEAVIHMLEPSYNVNGIAARRRNNANPLFKRGDVFRSVLGVLREATAPMTAREIVVALYQSQGVQSPTTAQVRHTYGGVNGSLRNNRGKTVETVGDSSPARWVIKLPSSVANSR